MGRPPREERRMSDLDRLAEDAAAVDRGANKHGLESHVETT